MKIEEVYTIIDNAKIPEDLKTAIRIGLDNKVDEVVQDVFNEVVDEVFKAEADFDRVNNRG